MIHDYSGVVNLTKFLLSINSKSNQVFFRLQPFMRVPESALQIFRKKKQKKKKQTETSNFYEEYRWDSGMMSGRLQCETSCVSARSKKNETHEKPRNWEFGSIK